MKKSIVYTTRIIGALLFILAIYMYQNDIEFSSKFQMANRGFGSSSGPGDANINYIKVLIVSLIIFFYREIRKYLDYVKYS